MNIFVTGGNGMVARNICKMAEVNGHNVEAPTREQLDLLNLDAVRQHLVKSSPDIVIHAAGLVGGIQANIASPFDFCYQNLQIGLNIIKASFDANINSLINLGSSCMYPRLAKNPLKESEILMGELESTNEGYAVAKIAVARMAQYISEQHGLRYKTIIPCNLYGMWDKFDPEKSHMIPAVIRKIHEASVNNNDIVEIWGDGQARREFLFVEDLVDFIFFVLEHFDDVPDTINVGLGYDYSVNEYYETIKGVIGFQGSFQHDLDKPTGMKQKLVDVSKQQALGWRPKTDLKTGIERTYQFFLNEIANVTTGNNNLG